MLPSRYIPMNLIYNRFGGCFDTGIYPSNTLNVKAFFNIHLANNYVFGARNTNSTSSAGQFGFYSNGGSNGTGNSYLCYASQQKSIGDAGNCSDRILIVNNSYNFDFNARGYYIYSTAGATTSFTGTQTIYLGAMNNAGAILYGTGNYRPVMYAFTFTRNDSVIADYCPAYDTVNQEYGFYEKVNGTFLTNIDTGSFPTPYLLEVNESTGGNAFIDTINAGDTKKLYYLNAKSYVALFDSKVKIKAIADKGYTFLNWTDNGVVYSTEEELEISISADTTLTANFIKDTELDTSVGYSLFGIKYGFGKPTSVSDPDGKSGEMYARVLSFECYEDGLNKQTSTIECQSVPAGFQIGVPVFLMNPKGKILYIGIIESVSNNTLYCREPISLYDTDFLFDNYTNSNKESIPWGIRGLLPSARLSESTTSPNLISYHRYRQTYSVDFGLFQMSYNRPMMTLMPTHEREIGNLEEYIQDIFNNYGIYMKAYMSNYIPTEVWLQDKGVYHLLGLVPDYNDEAELVIGDNLECITNISVEAEDEYSTYLFIVNSSMTTLRGAYAVKNDGSVVQIDNTDPNNLDQYIAYNNCVTQVISSDDNINSIVAGSLSNAMYNHEITFDVDLTTDMLRFEDFNVGRRVIFYYRSRMYISVITAKEFKSENTTDQITSIHVTLGKVRSTLTSKFNMGKLKK